MARISDLTVGKEFEISAKKSKTVSARLADSTRVEIPVGETVVIVTNEVDPDGTEFARCIKVRRTSGEVVYLLPKLLSDGTIVTSAVAPAVNAPASAPAVVAQKPIVDPMDVRLDPYRPSWDLLKKYVSRKLFGSIKDTDLLLHYWRTRDNNGYSANVLFEGDTQAGKTMFVQVLACLVSKELGFPKPLPVFTLSGSAGVTDYDLFGQSVAHIGADGVERLVFLNGIIELASKVPCILYLDEINMMPERVTSTLHPVADDRRSFVNRQKAVESEGEYLMAQTKMNTGCWIVGTMNPAGYRGTSPLNEAFANRFTKRIPWGYDRDVETKLLGSPSMVLLAESLREARRLGSIQTPVGTKLLVDAKKDIDALGVEIGLAVFASFFNERERPKVEAIINDKSIRTFLIEEQAGRTPQIVVGDDEPF
jgi:hypothetical protein